MPDFNAGLEAAAKVANSYDQAPEGEPSTARHIAKDILALRRPDPDAVREALRSLHTWVSVVAEKFDLDEDITCVRVSAVGPDGKRELASLSLRAVMDRASQALGGER